MTRTAWFARFVAAVAATASVSACSSTMTPAHVASVPQAGSGSPARIVTGAPDLLNLVRDGSFETPIAPSGGFLVFNVGSKFSKWHVVGASGDIGIISGTFAQNGFTFPAGCGKQWVDLTGIATTGAGVAQKIATVQGSQHVLTFSVGNVVDPGGIFGTTSTVNVLINGVQTFKAVNKKGVGQMVQVWKSFTTTITAPSSLTTITFVNGDPAGDDNNGLDCIKLN
jgi:uncharacterized protein DUF642